MNSELEVKTERLQRMMAAENLGGVLLNAQHNFAWLTGGRSNGIDFSRDNGASYLLIRRDRKRFLIANNIELPRLFAEEISEADFEPVEISWQDEKASIEAVCNTARSFLPDGAELGTDVFLSDKLRPIEPLIAVCRHQLTSAEVERFRLLGRDAGKALGDVITKLSPGESENEIARKVRDGFAVKGIFPIVTLVGADERIARYRHPVPTGNTWKETLLIAVCARRRGLIASLSRIVCVGEIPAELQRRTVATAAVNAGLYAAIVPGAKASDLYRIAENIYAIQSFPGEIANHHQGGACGYRTRDWVAHPTSIEIVKQNQAFAWNPSITGTKTEETGIVTADGFEVITATAGFPRISTIVGGREYFSPGILSLSKGASA